MRLFETYSAPFEVPVSASSQSIFWPSGRWAFQSLAAYAASAAVGAVGFFGFALFAAQSSSIAIWLSALTWIIALIIGTVVLKNLLPAIFAGPIGREAKENSRSFEGDAREGKPAGASEESRAIQEGPERMDQRPSKTEKAGAAPLMSAPTNEATVDARLERAIAGVDELIELARAAGSQSTMFLEMTRLQLLLEYNGITEQEFDAFRDALERDAFVEPPENRRITQIRSFSRRRLQLTVSFDGRRRSPSKRSPASPIG